MKNRLSVNNRTGNTSNLAAGDNPAVLFVLLAALILFGFSGCFGAKSMKTGVKSQPAQSSGKKPQNPHGSTIVQVQSTPPPLLNARQRKILDGARARLGDTYDSSYYSCGYPPEGKSACVDILYFAFKNVGIDLQIAVNGDIEKNRGAYPQVRDYAINHRWAPTLIIWFQRNAKNLTVKTDPKSIKEWQAGDVVFWNMLGDGVADHCGIISEKTTPAGTPLVIHQLGPACTEDDVLNRWKIVGHFRL